MSDPGRLASPVPTYFSFSDHGLEWNQPSGATNGCRLARTTLDFGAVASPHDRQAIFRRAERADRRGVPQFARAGHREEPEGHARLGVRAARPGAARGLRSPAE